MFDWGLGDYFLEHYFERDDIREKWLVVQEAYKIDSDHENKNSHFQEIELGMNQMLVQNVKKENSYRVSQIMVKLLLMIFYVLKE